MEKKDTGILALRILMRSLPRPQGPFARFLRAFLDEAIPGIDNRKAKHKQPMNKGTIKTKKQEEKGILLPDGNTLYPPPKTGSRL